MKPTGNTIRGHVLDVSHKPFSRALRFFDPQLYFVWNPKKCGKWGCWEIRRRPEEKSVRPEDVSVFQGNTIVFPKYHELSLVNHVIDLAYLNYNSIEKLKKMDMWNQKDMGHKGKHLTRTLDYNQAKFEERIDEKSSKELEYNLKQLKPEIRYFKDYVASGGNPHRLADAWGKT